jgi:hypothetical protein
MNRLSSQFLRKSPKFTLLRGRGFQRWASSEAKTPQSRVDRINARRKHSPYIHQRLLEASN